MESSKKKSKTQKIKQNKPYREKESQEDKEFRQDLQKLILLRQLKQTLIEANAKLNKEIEKKKNYVQEEQETVELQNIACDIDMMKHILRQKGIEFQQRRRPNRALWADNSLQHYFGIIRLIVPTAQHTAQHINQPSENLRRELEPLINTDFETMFKSIENQESQPDQNTEKEEKEEKQNAQEKSRSTCNIF